MSTAFGSSATVEDKTKDGDTTEEVDPDPHFEAIVKLEEVEVKTLEEDEVPTFKMRAKLFRYAKDSSEWKERGTGDVKLLIHSKSSKMRLVMRREKTHKVCANHFLTPGMKLSPNVGSDRSWVWNAPADFADGEAKQELLAIRFANSENANKFKEAFENGQKWMVKVGEGKLDEAALLKESDRPKALVKDEEDERKPEEAKKVSQAANAESNGASEAK